MNHNPRLNKNLHTYGKDALNIFKYFNEGDVNKLLSNQINDFICPENPSYCKKEEIKEKKRLISSNKCTLTEGIDYRGGDITTAYISAPDPDLCCKICKETQGCKHFTFTKAENICFLKSSKESIIESSSTVMLISGDI